MIIKDRICNICNKSSDFYHIRSHVCKQCQLNKNRIAYKENPKRNAYYKDMRTKQRHKHKEYIHNAKSKPCTDCHIQYDYWIMHFDHIKGDKIKNLSQMTSSGLRKIKAEIDKCEVVCANCHADRTYRRTKALVDPLD